MKVPTDIRKFSRSEKIKEWTRTHFWPNLDDTAQALYTKYEKAINKNPHSKKHEPNMKYDPIISSYLRKAITIGMIVGTATAIWYLSGCNEKEPTQEYNSLIKYSSNVSIQK